MKRFAKKAFTLVELLVVIAIIAILAVAGVVGYMAFTKKAEVNNDTSLFAELNNYVAAASATDKINTPTDIRNILVDDGIDLATLKLSAAKQGYVPGFDIVAKKFVLIKDNALADGYTAAKTSDVFAFAKTEAEANALKAAGFSLYLQSGYDKETIAIEGLGLDVGENTGITTINYTGASSANDVVIRSNGGSLTITAANDKVTHYGIANKVDIQAVASTSYVENGIVSIAKIKTGRIVVTPKAVLTSIHVVETNGNFNNIKVAVVGNAELPDFTRDDVEMENGDKKLVIEVQSIATVSAVDESPEYIWVSKTAGTTSTDVATSATTLDETTKVPVESQSTAAKVVATDTVEGITAEQLAEMEAVATRYAGGQGTESNPYLLATKAHFGSIDEDYHNGVTAGKYYKLVADLDLGKIYPIGSMSLSGNAGSSSTSYTITYASCFEGNIDGGNHSITYTLVADEGLAANSNSIGLFGAIENSTIKNMVINADIICDRQNVWVGGLAGFGWRCNLENVTVNGTINAAHDVGGFFGYYANGGYNGSVAISPANHFKNCISNATVVCNSKRTTYAIAGGFIGQFTPEYDTEFTMSFDNCQSNGTVNVISTTATYASASYYIGFASDNAATGGTDHAPVNVNICFDGCSVGNDASLTSSLGDKHTKSTHSVYSASSSEAISACPAIKYVGCTSRMDSVDPTKPSLNKIYINNVQQDMSLYFVE